MFTPIGKIQSPPFKQYNNQNTPNTYANTHYLGHNLGVRAFR